MPSFTPEQQAFIREIAYTVADIVIERHVETCPWGRRMRNGFYFGIGLGAGTGILGTYGLPLLIQLLKNA